VGTGPLPVPHHSQPHSIDLTLPPLATVALRHRAGSDAHAQTPAEDV
jgi:hypothetical protein